MDFQREKKKGEHIEMEEKKRGKKRAERVSWNCFSGLDVED